MLSLTPRKPRAAAPAVAAPPQAGEPVGAGQPGQR